MIRIDNMQCEDEEVDPNQAMAKEGVEPGEARKLRASDLTGLSCDLSFIVSARQRQFPPDTSSR